MQVRWLLSQFHIGDDGIPVPICADYGGKWDCPIVPSTEDGWALVQMDANAHQVESMSTDSRIVVCPYLFDPRPVPDQIITIYSSVGAVTGMSIAALLATLSDGEPRYGHTL